MQAIKSTQAKSSEQITNTEVVVVVVVVAVVAVVVVAAVVVVVVEVSAEGGQVGVELKCDPPSSPSAPADPWSLSTYGGTRHISPHQCYRTLGSG
jgi:hypothetical protein